ncbi:MAG: hypothetical protein BGN93_09840 [Acinetobacter sp. 39-4]|jgi:hypothetical protein|uniref:YagK/YfjJ domain-containing protein n=1 Tax=Acinetobacter modestus TaxID=1776740 RepID=UPI00095FB4C4|nr:inovirus-type Gp2 protein [uncultured Acinetobacter sp.]OJU85896.1 MAG: hypothetical protein BGN93_09840 [Acinetobacter sp. 39-4]OJU92496.1 MAG: hypothetical protein BGO19_12040 [Acinetobacter sp. 38-8]
MKLHIDQSYISILQEQSAIQDKIIKDKAVTVSNPVLELNFLIIRIIEYIRNNFIQSLYRIGANGFVTNTIDKHLDGLLKSITSIETLENSRYYCAEVEIFIRAYRHLIQSYIDSCDERHFWESGPNLPCIHNGDECIPPEIVRKGVLINRLVSKLDELIYNEPYKQIRRNRADKSEHQYKRSIKLVTRLRETNSKLLVLRIDFSLKGQEFNATSLEEIREYLSKLLKRFHFDTALPEIVGYIWKLEFGEQKGYHYHCIFFLDGNKYQKDAYYADQIGQVWQKITEEKGIYFNCHRDKFKYRHLAIGMARHDDQEFFDNLDQVLIYICKQDQFLIEKSLNGEDVRTFQTSVIPKEAKPLGRPRNKPTQLDTDDDNPQTDSSSEIDA